jgi:hypothetical protein
MKYIDSKTLHLQTKLLSKSIKKNSILLALTNVKPSNYWEHDILWIFPNLHPSFQQYGQDNLVSFIILKNDKFVSFIDFHPIHNNERFFFNMLLLSKKNFISEHNIHQYYVQECQNWDLLPNLESLYKSIHQYATWILLENEKKTQLFNKMLKLHPYESKF